MNRIGKLAATVSAVAASVAAICSYAINKKTVMDTTDKDGHILTNLWKDYERESSADRPQKAEQILDAIVTKAKSEGYVWDFYDGLRKWHDTVLSRDWKRRNEARRRVADEAAGFDNPVVLYNLMKDRLIDEKIDRRWYDSFITGRRSGLVQDRNSVIYSSDGSLGENKVPAFVTENISNDYEYVLWSLALSRKSFYSNVSAEVSDKAKLDLAEYLGGSYPLGAYLEFLDIMDENRGNYESEAEGDSGAEKSARAKTDALKAFEEKYAGKAVALFASQEMLRDRKNSIDKDIRGHKAVASEDCRKLRDDCAVFEKLRKSFTGKEAEVAKCCTEVEQLIESLDFKRISVYMDNLDAVAVLGNVGKIEIELRRDSLDGPVVDKARLENPVRNYYVPDTLRYSFPENLDDGKYFIVCRDGNIKETKSFSKNTLSAAVRTNAAGSGIYLADYLSGKPVEKADLEFRSKGKPIKKVADFVFDGFSSIQEILSELKKDCSGAIFLVCSLTDEKGVYRCSKEIYLYDNIPHGRESVYDGCMIFKDRSAFVPGDTVKFKAVLYTVRGSGYSVSPAGKTVKAVLYGADGQEVHVLDLETGEYGSVAGEFAIPEGLRGGRFRISVFDGETLCGQSALVVDEFVLPTFNLEFDKDTSLHYNGDDVTIKGHIASYSGHSLSGAKLSYAVRSGRRASETACAGEIKVSPQGDFGFSFRIPEDSDENTTWYVEVKAVDLTGETLEWSTSFRSEPSVYFELYPENQAEASVYGGDKYDRHFENSRFAVMDGNVAKFKADVYAYTGAGYRALPIEVKYRVMSEGNEVCSGTVLSGTGLSVDLSGRPSGLYVVEAESEYVHPKGKVKTFRQKCSLLKTDRNDIVLDADVDFFTKKYADGASIAVQIGGAKGPEWVVAELYGDKAQLLRSEIVYLDGIKGEEGSVKMLEYEYLEEYPETVRLLTVSFKNGKARESSYDFSRPETSSSVMPVEFTSFVDKTGPRGECVFGIKTLPDVECAVSVFDVSTERIAGNFWQTLRKTVPSPVYAPVRTYCGGIAEDFHVRGYGRNAYMSAIAGSPALKSMASADAPDAVEMMDIVEDDSVVEEKSEEKTDAVIRDKFDNTLAFLPFLRSDADGNISFKVNASDKLSTYCVQVFAHGKDMANGVSRRNFTVTIPVKVNVVQPQFLYGGDVYRLKASVSNGNDLDADGVLQLYVYDSEDYKNTVPIMEKSIPLCVKAGEAASGEFEVAVPAKDAGSVLGFKVVFRTETGGTAVSDGLFVSVPVLVPVQTLVEAHSALLRPGMDRDSLRNALASGFTGTLGQTYGYKEISLLDMILEAIPDKAEPKSKDVLSLTEAYYVRLMSSVLSDRTASVSRSSSVMSGVSPSVMSSVSEASANDLLSRILDCQNADGGFAWFEGFRSSPVLTAAVLERFAILRGFMRKAGSAARGTQAAEDSLAVPLGAAVKYLDDLRFAQRYPFWCGGISLEQYIYIRSMYPEVAFSPDVDKKKIAAFRTEVRDWLLPSKSAGLEGYILGKARRAATALNLSEKEASSLASSLGVPRGKLLKTAETDMGSLFEYAVRHPSGGFYYPNAVMPFRGLLESEVYAHSLLCDLMSRYSELCSASSKRGSASDAETAYDIAEGIRLWLMVQKETQRWENDPAYVNAVNSVLNGSDKVRESVIAVLEKRYMKPFGEIQAAGNGFTVVRKYYRETAADEKEEGGSGKSRMAEIKEGDVLALGDKIIAEYKVWSAENRSFVRLSSPRCAALRPVKQLSGIVGGFARPVPVMGVSDYAFTPYAYREVKADRTDWYMDVCPEEYTVFSEEFHVTQSGVFTAPAVVIESLYSSHYRANDMFGGLVRVE